jgi:hypothetical protein
LLLGTPTSFSLGVLVPSLESVTEVEDAEPVTAEVTTSETFAFRSPPVRFLTESMLGWIFFAC